MQALEIASLDEFAALRAEWSALLDRSPTTPPFLAPEWLLPWWTHFGRARLRAIALRAGGALAALAPLFEYEQAGRRRLAFVGAGITDYHGLLAGPGGRLELAGEFLRQLSLLDDWDECSLDQLARGEALLEVPPPPGLVAETREQDVCPVLALPPTFAELEPGMQAQLRSRLHARYPRRLATLGRVTYDIARADTLAEFLEALFELQRARWQAGGGVGVLSAEGLEAFHAEVARGMLARGWLRLHGLRIDGRLVAVLYVLARGPRAYAYLSGFAPGLANYSPGVLLTARAIETAIDEGAREFDFLRGAEPHKYRWGARDRINQQLALTRIASSAAPAAPVPTGIHGRRQRRSSPS
ncbi:MAG: GNAT family N-acetyltransferase [Acidobacteria bacterium]|nr:GNAT family N-acetyltransferase [Acidobacteriota bacterium]